MSEVKCSACRGTGEIRHIGDDHGHYGWTEKCGQCAVKQEALDRITYDASGVCFMRDVTEFTLENVYAACRAVRITTRMLDELHIEMNLQVFDKLDSMYQIDFYPDGVTRWHRFTVSVAPDFPGNKSIVDCKITDKHGKMAILRTREY